MSKSSPTPQNIQNAIACLDNSHTGIHRALTELKNGGIQTAKQTISVQIAALASALSIL